jgi:hypothetical protein
MAYLQSMDSSALMLSLLLGAAEPIHCIIHLVIPWKYSSFAPLKLPSLFAQYIARKGSVGSKSRSRSKKVQKINLL